MGNKVKYNTFILPFCDHIGGFFILFYVPNNIKYTQYENFIKKW
jgi:hypothetical protein